MIDLNLKLERMTGNRDVLLSADEDWRNAAVLDDDLFNVEDLQEKLKAMGAALQ